MKIKRVIKFGVLCGIILISIFLQYTCSKNEDDLLIEVSTSGCYTSCPIVDIRVQGDQAILNLIKFNDQEGVYKYELSREEKNNLETLFKVLKLEKIEEKYTSTRVDMQTYSIYLSKGNREKFVYYYEGEAPKNLEGLVDQVIQLKSKNLVKTNDTLNIKTRNKVPILDIPMPPVPDVEGL